MSQRTIKGPATKGSISVESIAAHAADLQSSRAAAKSPRTSAVLGRGPDAAFMRSMTPSSALAAIIGEQALPRAEVTKRVWDYIKKHGLQDSAQRTMVNADAKLRKVLGQAHVSRLDLPKHIDKNLS